LLDIHENRQPWVVQVCLQDTIDAIKWAIHPGADYLILAATILFGAGTGFKKLASITAKKKLTFAGREITTKIDIEIIRFAPFLNNRPRQPCPCQYFLRIVQMQTGLFHINPIDVQRWVTPGKWLHKMNTLQQKIAYVVLG
jgi:hypothetical protein